MAATTHPESLRPPVRQDPDPAPAPAGQQTTGQPAAPTAAATGSAPPHACRRGWISKVRETLLAAVNAAGDSWDYLRYSGTLDPYRRRLSFQAILTKHYHSLEKGLSLEKPRPGFGVAIVRQLLAEIPEYRSRFGSDAVSDVATRVLASYLDFNRRNPVADPQVNALLDRIDDLLRRHPASAPVAGVLEVSGDDLQRRGRIDFASFVHSRHSVRHFGPDPVNLEDLRKAVALAQRSPSVCNRQAWRVHAYTDPATIRRVLAHQSGNRGFGDTSRAILIVTAELAAFEGGHERHEAYVDGGLFSMSLVYALHAQGLGSCCLNLCQQSYQAARTRRAAGIPDSEVLIMMIAVGTLPKSLRVACSYRPPVDDVLTHHDA